MHIKGLNWSYKSELIKHLRAGIVPRSKFTRTRCQKHARYIYGLAMESGIDGLSDLVRPLAALQGETGYLCGLAGEVYEKAVDLVLDSELGE